MFIAVIITRSNLLVICEVNQFDENGKLLNILLVIEYLLYIDNFSFLIFQIEWISVGQSLYKL